MQFCRGGKAMPLKDVMEQFQDEFPSKKSAGKISWFATKISLYRDREIFDQTRCSDISCWNLKDALFCISCRCFFGEKMWMVFLSAMGYPHLPGLLGRWHESRRLQPSLKLTAKAPENGWLVHTIVSFLGRLGLFSGGTPCSTSRECIVCHVQSHFQKESVCVFPWRVCKHLNLAI